MTRHGVEVMPSPRFRFYRHSWPWGWEWQLSLPLFSVWGGLTGRMSVAVEATIDGTRIHVHASLLWLWISADIVWPVWPNTQDQHFGGVPERE